MCRTGTTPGSHRTRCTAGGDARRSALVVDDVPDDEARIRLDVGGGGQYLRDGALLVRAELLQKEVRVVQRLAGEVHLRDDAVDLSDDLEVQVRRPHPVRVRRVRA